MKTPAYRIPGLLACILLHLALALALSSLVHASGYSRNTASEQICDQVARIAAQETGVPFSVLQAITRTETGRKRDGRFSPWPWTVNMEGKGVWFDSLDDARAYVFRHFKQGARSFDVGCFQINYKWHHQGFSSIDEMFDPLANALYAAGFLKDLHAEQGNWPDAAGAYHSRTPKYAKRYKAIFEKHHRSTSQQMAALSDPMPTTAQRAATSENRRVNRFPLLQGGDGATPGSLVPLSNGGGRGGFLRLTRSDAPGLFGG